MTPPFIPADFRLDCLELHLRAEVSAAFGVDDLAAARAYWAFVDRGDLDDPETARRRLRCLQLAVERGPVDAPASDVVEAAARYAAFVEGVDV